METENMYGFIVRNYPPEGGSFCKLEDADERFFTTLEDARADALRRLGDLDDWRKWDGYTEDGSDEIAVEAYHESIVEGCGGVEINREDPAAL